MLEIVSADPFTGDRGKFAERDGFVVGFAFGSDKRDANLTAPNGAHTLAGVAAVTLAKSVFVESPSADFSQVFFVNPSLADSHHIGAVIEHEAVTVGVAEEVEGDDVATAIDGGDGLIAGIDPDQFGVSFGGLFSDPLGVWLAIFLSANNVARFVNDPGQAGIFAMNFPKFVAADRGGGEEVPPKAIMPVSLYPEVFPVPQGGSSGENDVFPGHDRGGDRQENKEEKTLHAERMESDRPGIKTGER